MHSTRDRASLRTSGDKPDILVERKGEGEKKKVGSSLYFSTIRGAERRRNKSFGHVCPFPPLRTRGDKSAEILSHANPCRVTAGCPPWCVLPPSIVRSFLTSACLVVAREHSWDMHVKWLLGGVRDRANCYMLRNIFLCFLSLSLFPSFLSPLFRFPCRVISNLSEVIPPVIGSTTAVIGSKSRRAYTADLGQTFAVRMALVNPFSIALLLVSRLFCIFLEYKLQC